MKKRIVSVFLILIFGMLITASHSLAAGNYFFQWTANPEPVEGYCIYWRIPPVTTYSKTASASKDVGKPTAVNGTITYTFDASNLSVGVNYCFALTAYQGLDESGHTTNDVCVETPAGSGDVRINMVSWKVN